MGSAAEDLATIVRWLVDQPGAVAVRAVPAGERTVLELEVAPTDLGKVIGRDGRTMRALRTLLAARDERQGGRHELELLED